MATTRGTKTDLVGRKDGTGASRSAGGGAYDAFISYSHAADGRLAPELQKGLQRFAKPWYRTRALRVFRDDDSLSANPDLWQSIERALDASTHLILLASPEAARSKWVAQETAYWCEHKSADTILIGLTSGELSWDQRIPSDSDALPAPLRTALQHEPRVTDLTWARDADDLSLSYPKFREAVADLAAPLHGKDKDELASEEVVQHRRTVRIARGAAGALVTLTIAAVIATVLALISRSEAVHQQHLATSRALAAESLLVLPSDPQLSLLLAVQSAKVSETPEALSAVRAALPQNLQLRSFQPSQQPLTGAAWSPDQSLVLTGNATGGATLWNAATGRVQKQLAADTANATFAAFDRTGDEVLTWNGDATGLWRVAGNAPPLRFPGTLSAAISPDDRLVATAGESSGVTISQAATGRALRTLSTGHFTAGSLQFSPDGRWLVAAEGYDVGVWNVATWQPLPLMAPNPQTFLYVFSVSFSPDGTRLAISQDDTDAPRLGDQVTNEAITRVYSVPDEAPVTRVLPGGLARWSPHGQYLATTTSAGNVDLWNARTGSLHLQLGSQVQLAGPAVFSSDSTVQGVEVLRYVASGSASGSAVVWDATSGLQLATLSGQPGQVTPAAFSSDATKLLTFGNDGSARTWSTGIVIPRPIGNPGLRARVDPDDSEASEQHLLDADPMAPVVATSAGVPDGAAAIFDVSSGATLATLPGLGSSGFAFDAAGRVMVVTSDGTPAPPTAQLRSVHGGGLLHALGGAGVGAVGGAVSRDGHLAATVGRLGQIAVWDVASGRLVRVFDGFAERAGDGSSITIKWSPDGTLLLGTDPKGLTLVWNARTGHVLNRIQGPARQDYTGAGGAISPDDRYLVTVSTGSNYARLYRIGQPAAVTTFNGLAGPIWDAAFNEDGSLIVTTSPQSQQSTGDGTIRVWSLSDQQPLLTLPGVAGTRVAFSADGHSIITNLDPGLPAGSIGCVVCGGFPYLLRLARARETRQLTPAERAQYLHG